jgi:hypothetical protein
MAIGPAPTAPAAMSAAEALALTENFIAYLNQPSLLLDAPNAEAYARRMDQSHGRRLEELVLKVSGFLLEGYAELSQRFNEARHYDEDRMKLFFRRYFLTLYSKAWLDALKPAAHHKTTRNMRDYAWNCLRTLESLYAQGLRIDEAAVFEQSLTIFDCHDRERCIGYRSASNEVLGLLRDSLATFDDADYAALKAQDKAIGLRDVLELSKNKLTAKKMAEDEALRQADELKQREQKRNKVADAARHKTEAAAKKEAERVAELARQAAEAEAQRATAPTGSKRLVSDGTQQVDITGFKATPTGQPVSSVTLSGERSS